jgi:spore coat protein A, manganese oxidase
MATRRNFIKMTTMAGASAFLLRGKAWPYAQSPTNIRKFIVPVPGLGPSGIPVAAPNTSRYPGCDFYQMVAGEYTQQLHPDLPATRLWGYADITNGAAPNHRYLGGAIVAQKGRPIRLNMLNRLPNKHPLPVDKTLMGAEPDQPENRICVHLHGGEVSWESDGGPLTWYAPDGSHGSSFVNGTGTPGEAQYYYPNNQSARLVWYHDHAIGITRLNAYAGLASAYIITDPVEQSLINNKIIPSRQIPLIIQDKTFKKVADAWGNPGDLWYPYQYEKSSEPDESGRWDYGPDMTPAGTVSGPLPEVSCVPEFFSDTILVNGTCYPYAEVEARHYRLRILNASQARFFNLQLYYADATGMEADFKKPGPRMVQIATEGGFLPYPVALNNPPTKLTFNPETGNPLTYNLLMAPAERSDIIIDFSRVPVGSKLILYSDAPAPFPGGDDRNDYYTGNPDFSSLGGAPQTLPGLGPNTRTLMQFRVVPRVGAADPASLNLLEAIALNPVGNAVANALLPALEVLQAKNATRVRNLTLNEDFDEYGRLIQRLGTVDQNGLNTQGLPTWARDYMAQPTEMPHNGDTEVWRIFNMTGDTHPMHFHLVNVQVLGRQTFDPGDPEFGRPPDFKNLGKLRLPDPNERGWKETVRMSPGEVTTVIMKFKIPSVPYPVQFSPRLKTDYGINGYEYVWHCHILEHEEHDMMRPLVVLP